MNGFDYRIHSRKDEFTGRITEILPGNGDYCIIRLLDGRRLRFVKYIRPSSDTVALEVGEKVRLRQVGGGWAIIQR